MKHRAALLLSLLLLGGCWQSRGTLYGDATPATPFKAGTVTQTGKDSSGKALVQHFALTLEANGAYRMIGTDKGQDDFGEGFVLRFFPLPGLPRDAYVYEAISLTHCARASGCAPLKADDPRYYGIALKTTGGVAEIRPDCERDAAATKPFGIKNDSGTCDFSNRAVLEKSLLALANSGKKAAYDYTLR